MKVARAQVFKDGFDQTTVVDDVTVELKVFLNNN